MASLSSQVEIASPPARVREIFFQLSRFPEWSSQSFIRSITPLVEKATIDEGDTLKVVLEGMTIQPKVIENSERQFMWRGDLYGLLHGDHYFRFEPSQSTPGGTTFVHGEEFGGPLAFLMSWTGMIARAALLYERFNEDFKKHVEAQI